MRNLGTRARPPRSTARAFERLVSHRIITLANLLRRSATLRYRRLFGLALIEWRVIAALGTGRAVSLNELARRLGLSKSQMSRGVAGLVASRFVSRTTSDRDGRGIALALTAKGRGVYAALKENADERNRTLVAGMRTADLRRLGGFLDRLTERAHGLLRAEAKRGRGRPR